MPNEMDDWFEVLGHLKSQRFPQLQELNLAMSACHIETAYDLPERKIKGDWTTEDCFVILPSGKPADYRFQRNLWDELEMHQDVDEFWDELTDQKWASKQTTRWKRRRVIEARWMLEMRQLRNPYYIDESDPDVQWVNLQIDRLDAEVDD